MSIKLLKLDLTNEKTRLFILHSLIFIYSIGCVFGKAASYYSTLNIQFWICYLGMIFILFLYAYGWQKILSSIPMGTAFIHKAAEILWGMIFGILLFNEKLTINKIVGIFIIMLGLLLYTKSYIAESLSDIG